MGQLNKMSTVSEMCGLMMARFCSRKMEETAQNILWLSGANVTLSYGKEQAFCVYCIFLLRFG